MAIDLVDNRDAVEYRERVAVFKNLNVPMGIAAEALAGEPASDPNLPAARIG